jgi:hypothetical protein
MTTYHILNGDCLADQLGQTKINQDFIVCRECLIDGNLTADNSSDFWAIRAKFIADTYNTSTEEYFNRAVKEFEKLKTLPDNSEVCLWFENDLFCQTNMWFVISLLAIQPTIKLYRVFPTIKNNIDTWKGFGISSAEMLEQSYSSKVLFKSQDIDLGNNLWTAYKSSNFKKLKELSNIQSDCFQYLEEVCQAHIDRFPTDNSLGRPDKTVKEIIETKSTNFEDVFSEFSIRQGIYGFGDLQLKNIYDRQI